MAELQHTDVFRTQLVARLEASAEEMVDAISSAMFADLGPYQQLAGPGEVDRLRADIRDMLVAFRRMVGRLEPFAAEELKELHLLGGRRAREGIPLDAVTDSVEIAMRVMWRFVRDNAHVLATTSDGEAHVTHAAAVVADLALETRDFMADLTAAIVAGYRTEREHGDSGRAHATADLVDEILEGRWDNTRRLRQAARSLGHEISEPLVVVLLAPPEGAELPDVAALASEVATCLPLALMSRLRRSPGPHVAVLVPHGNGIDPDKVRAAMAATPLARHAVVFVDDAARSLVAVPPAYNALASELAAARVMANGAGVVSPRDTDLLRLLRSLALADRLDFVRRVLGPVLELPPGKAGEVVGTLQAYFRGRGRLDETAADLRLHRNSFRYRLDRAQTLLGVSFRDAADRLKVEVALALHELARYETGMLDDHVGDLASELSE